MLDIFSAFWNASLLTFVGITFIPIIVLLRRDRLARVDRGYVAIVFGLMLLAFGTFVDYGVAVIINLEMQSAIPSALWDNRGTLLAALVFFPGAVLTGIGLSTWLPALQRLDQEVDWRKQAEKEIRRLAMTDQLTGIANRNQFHNRFEEHLKLARRERKNLALMLLDLDMFKPVNDTYGHPVGDGVLKEVAAIFTKYSRDTDVVARLGGDEFAILVVHPQDRDTAGRSAERLLQEVMKPMTVLGHDIQISTSIGIGLYPEDAEDEESLIRKADQALYEAKKAGRNTFRFYDPDKETAQLPLSE